MQMIRIRKDYSELGNPDLEMYAFYTFTSK